VILGTGQLRSSLNAGLVTFGALYRVLPGDDLLAVADLKPEEAQDLVRAMSLKGGNAVTVAVSSGWQAKEEQTTPRINSIKPPAELAQKSTWKVATTEWKFRGFPEIVGKAEKEGRIRYFANKTLRDTIAAGLGGVLPSRCQ
jgi:2',3'-cyclic-nucleotide 2'-phosphodiesterase (5'-nucleotidase family)